MPCLLVLLVLKLSTVGWKGRTQGSDCLTILNRIESQVQIIWTPVCLPLKLHLCSLSLHPWVPQISAYQQYDMMSTYQQVLKIQSCIPRSDKNGHLLSHLIFLSDLPSCAPSCLWYGSFENKALGDKEGAKIHPHGCLGIQNEGSVDRTGWGLPEYSAHFPHSTRSSYTVRICVILSLWDSFELSKGRHC